MTHMPAFVEAEVVPVVDDDPPVPPADLPPDPPVPPPDDPPDDPPEDPPVDPPPPPDLPPEVDDLGDPVDAVRAWDGCIQANGTGGFRWIKPFYTPPSLVPCEFVIADLDQNSWTNYLETGWTAGKSGKYPSQNFGPHHQLRAANGRIFMPSSKCGVYYAETDGTVHDLGRVQLPAGGGNAPDSTTYSMVFNTDGSLLLGGSGASSNTDHRPLVFKLDPSTLTMTFLARVGSTTRTLNGYSYYLWAVGNWLYALCGEEVWDVVAINITTGVATTLATETVNAWAYFVQIPGKGLTVQLVKNNRIAGEVVTQSWLIDGALVAYTVGVDPPGGNVDVTPYSNVLANMPQIDEALIQQHVVKWRPFGSSGSWTKNKFDISHTDPMAVDSLATLPDGVSVLGDVEQYQGFYRVNSDGSIENYGAWNAVTEGSARCVANGKMYISGYPNGILEEYDPGADWDIATTTLAALRNPKLLGSYSNGVSFSGVKRANALAYGATPSRLYMAGLRDRTAIGAGIGYYNFSGTPKFAGHFTGLNFYRGHLGLVVSSLGYVIFGGLIGDDPAHPGGTPTEAQIIIHDVHLVELERQTPVAGMLDTGRLYMRASEPSVVIGLSIDGQRAWRWDFVIRTLLASVDLSAEGAIGVSTQDADGNLIAVLGTLLVRINAATLARTTLLDIAASLPAGQVTCIASVTGAVVLSIGATVYRVTP